MADDILYEKFVDNIITASQNYPTEIQPIIYHRAYEDLRNKLPNGRIVIDIEGDSSSHCQWKTGCSYQKPNHIYLW